MEKEQVTQTGQWLISGPAILLGLLYLTWRGMATLDAADPIGIGWVLYMAEIASFAAMVSLFVQAIRPMKRRTDPPIDPAFLPTVEILVSVDRESVEQAYRTIISAAALRYPSASKTITLLDRGGKRDDREALQSLAKQFQCRYLLLPSEGADGKRFDASPSFGEYLLVLQAGDIPQPDLLRKTIGFFSQHQVGFVQIARRRLNYDPFQSAFLLQKEIPAVDALFHRVIAPGLDYAGAAPPLGSGTLYRRAALQALSPAIPETEAGALGRGALLHARGWRSVYLDQGEVLQSAATSQFEAYLRERRDQIRDALGLLLGGLPLRGLTLKQAFGYIAALAQELLVLPRLIFLIAPLGFLVGRAPISADAAALVGYFFPFYLSRMAASHFLAGRHRHPLWSAVYETADVAALCLKGKQSSSASISGSGTLLWGLAAVEAAGMLFGVFLMVRGASPWPTVLLGEGWALYNFLLLVTAASTDRRIPKRSHPRITRQVDCRIITPDRTWTGKTVEISETGLSLTMSDPISLPREVEIDLRAENPISLRGTVVRNEAFSKGGASVGVLFHPLSMKEREWMVRWLYARPETLPTVSYSFQAGVIGWLTAVGRASVDEDRLYRGLARYEIFLPCRLFLDKRVLNGKTIDVSAEGMSLKVGEDPGPLSKGVVAELRIIGLPMAVQGRPIWSRRRNGHWEIGLHLDTPMSPEFLGALLPDAPIKVVSGERFQNRTVHFMARLGAIALSALAAVLVVLLSVRAGWLPPFRPLREQRVYHFFWLFFFFILADGVKVYIEILGRARPRTYRSDLSQVTAVIPCHDSASVIEYTLENLMRFLPKERIIVVDDASRDATAEIARRAGARVLTLKENQGKPRAIQIGLREVQTRYILLLDDDTRLNTLFLPTSLLEEGNTGVAFYVLPCRRTRENFDGKDLVSCLQRYEYAKSMEIGKRFQDKTVSVSCISGAIGLFRTDRLRSLQPLHSNLFPGEDLERTLIDLLHGGKIAFVNDPVWTICPDNWKDLTRQRLFNWYPGFYRLFGFYLKIFFHKQTPGRLRFEMFYNFYVMFSDPFKVFSFIALLLTRQWGGLLFLYLFYLALEIYPFLTVEKKMPTARYYLPALLLFPLFGIYSTFLRFGSLFVWLWNRFVTRKWRPRHDPNPS